MIIVLDSNEYINFLNKKIFFPDKIFTTQKITICINELIVREILRNINEALKSEFYNMLFKNNINLFNERLQFDLYDKYEKLGLKKGDIVIAAFCEYVEAEYLISENRHFLKSTKFAKFKVLNIKDFLKIL